MNSIETICSMVESKALETPTTHINMSGLTLREKFEMTKLFKEADMLVGEITYKQFGGYFIDDTPYFYLNGAFQMFKEFEIKISCNHNWVGKSENQYCSKCGIGEE